MKFKLYMEKVICWECPFRMYKVFEEIKNISFYYMDNGALPETKTLIFFVFSPLKT